MIDADKSNILPERSDIMREMAQDMNVALYRRYGRTAAAKILSIPEGELESLRASGHLAYLHISDNHIGFFGCQLLTYPLNCIIPVGEGSRPSHAPTPEPTKPAVNPAAELISVNDTLTMLGIGRTKLYELLNAKEIESVKIGKRTLIKQASLRRFTDLQAD